MATLHWEMRQVLPQLRDSGRLTILVALILHANVRNRAWPSLDLLVTETGYAKATVNEAKEWLLEHKAIELIKFKDRAGDEVGLPVRQNVYQLTGSIEIEKKNYRYLYTSHENSLNSSVSERSLVESSVSELEGSTSIKGSSKKKVAPNGAARVADPFYDAIQAVWKYEGAMNGLMKKMLAGVATKAGWKEYNVTPEVTPTELLSWAKWYRRTHLHNNAALNMLEERAKIQSSIYQYRQLPQRTSVVATLAPNQQAPELEDFIVIGKSHD